MSERPKSANPAINSVFDDLFPSSAKRREQQKEAEAEVTKHLQEIEDRTVEFIAAITKETEITDLEYRKHILATGARMACALELISTFCVAKTMRMLSE